MSPLLKSVEKAGISGVQSKRNPFQISPADFFKGSEILRSEFAKLINTTEKNRIVLIPSVSYGMANVMNNLRATSGENIIVAAEQFPSNYYPWEKISSDKKLNLKIISTINGNGRGKIWNERILDAIDSKTKLVALGHVHWADGTMFQLEEIRKRTKHKI